MTTALVGKTLREFRRSAIGWAVGATAILAMYLGFYSQMDMTAAMKQDMLPEGMKQAMGITDNWASGVGYLEITVFSMIGPLLLIMCAVLLGARTVAGPEGSGTLDLLMANPVSRKRFVWQRFLAMFTYLAAIGVILWGVILLLSSAQDMGVPLGNVSAAVLSLMLMTVMFGVIALAVGAATGSRAAALATAGGLAVLSYILNMLSRMIEGGEWLKWLSAFHYAYGGDPLRQGMSWEPLILAGVAIAGLLVALVTFDRRDVGV